jgi:hypothetical protein
MDRTGGGERPFSAGTLDEVIQHAKAAVQGEADQRAEEERKQRLAAEERAQEADQRAEEADQRANGIDRVHRDEADRKGHRRGLAVGWAITLVLIVAFLIGAACIPHGPSSR